MNNMKSDKSRGMKSSKTSFFPSINLISSDLSGYCKYDSFEKIPKKKTFPPKLRMFIQLIERNTSCPDCHLREPGRAINVPGEFKKGVPCANSDDLLPWANVEYGTLICEDCACRHIQLNEKTSSILSLDHSHWSLPQILAILEGGNANFLKKLEKNKDHPKRPTIKSWQSFKSSRFITQVTELSNTTVDKMDDFESWYSGSVQAESYKTTLTQKVADACRIHGGELYQSRNISIIAERNVNDGTSISTFLVHQSRQGKLNIKLSLFSSLNQRVLSVSSKHQDGHKEASEPNTTRTKLSSRLSFSALSKRTLNQLNMFQSTDSSIETPTDVKPKQDVSCFFRRIEDHQKPSTRDLDENNIQRGDLGYSYVERGLSRSKPNNNTESSTKVTSNNTSRNKSSVKVNVHKDEEENGYLPYDKGCDLDNTRRTSFEAEKKARKVTKDERRLNDWDYENVCSKQTRRPKSHKRGSIDSMINSLARLNEEEESLPQDKDYDLDNTRKMSIEVEKRAYETKEDSEDYEKFVGSEQLIRQKSQKRGSMTSMISPLTLMYNSEPKTHDSLVCPFTQSNQRIQERMTKNSDARAGRYSPLAA
mmetsp:Transcript_8392/g.9221  ORF Transcript_8392/g.9221 Transcript_8392/m.9221 type:complete len:592 (-) Transcript_8392:119-1894(-)